MDPGEFEAALQTAFTRCDAASCSLTERQKQILLQAVEELKLRQTELLDTSIIEVNGDNPLDELTPEQRQRFLQFVREQERQHLSWKTQLLNDWLHDRDSGAVQFVREQYGPAWLNRIKPVHFNKYAEMGREQPLKLKVGDRIEVSNGLWEWVQETGPCSREWFSCTVVSVIETSYGDGAAASCIIRFNNGAEYEIQGVYSWNRYNWRWAEE